MQTKFYPKGSPSTLYIEKVIEKNPDLEKLVNVLINIKNPKKYKDHFILSFMDKNELEKFYPSYKNQFILAYIQMFYNYEGNNLEDEFLNLFLEEIENFIATIDESPEKKQIYFNILEKTKTSTITHDDLKDNITLDNSSDSNVISYLFIKIQFIIAKKTIAFIKEATDQEIKDLVLNTESWTDLNQILYSYLVGAISEQEFTLKHLSPYNCNLAEIKLIATKEINAELVLLAFKIFRNKAKGLDFISSSLEEELLEKQIKASLIRVTLQTRIFDIIEKEKKENKSYGQRYSIKALRQLLSPLTVNEIQYIISDTNILKKFSKELIELELEIAEHPNKDILRDKGQQDILNGIKKLAEDLEKEEKKPSWTKTLNSQSNNQYEM
jgi:hypothetical protein